MEVHMKIQGNFILDYIDNVLIHIINTISTSNNSNIIFILIIINIASLCL